MLILMSSIGQGIVNMAHKLKRDPLEKSGKFGEAADNQEDLVKGLQRKLRMGTIQLRIYLLSLILMVVGSVLFFIFKNNDDALPEMELTELGITQLFYTGQWDQLVWNDWLSLVFTHAGVIWFMVTLVSPAIHWVKNKKSQPKKGQQISEINQSHDRSKEARKQGYIYTVFIPGILILMGQLIRDLT